MFIGITKTVLPMIRQNIYDLFISPSTLSSETNLKYFLFRS